MQSVWIQGFERIFAAKNDYRSDLFRQLLSAGYIECGKKIKILRHR